jgi:hypothetical protein
MGVTDLKRKNHFETLIVGGGLSGLLIGAQLAQQGRSVLILEEKDDLGGFCRPSSHSLASLNFGFKSLPANSTAHQALDFLEQVMRISVLRREVDETPLTFDSGKFKPFVGFGAQPPESINELDYYLCPQRIFCDFTPGQWIDRLKTMMSDEQYLLRSQVTRILIEDGQALGVIVNGDRTWTADQVVYAGPIKYLPSLLPTGAMTARTTQRLAKASYWSAICLDLIHPTAISESSSLYVLSGSGDEVSPSLGYFYPPANNTQISQWLTFVAPEGSEDPEVAGACVRRIKKQIKRAFPEAQENLVHERIYMAELSHGTADLKLKDDVLAPGITSLYLGGPGVHREHNLIAVSLQAQLILSALGAIPKSPSLSEIPPTDLSIMGANSPLSDAPEPPL